MNQPKHNVIRLYIIKSAKWFLLIMPIIVPFYKSNGLDQFDIMLLQSVVYSLTIAVFEIPSGYLADLWGRKNTLITGAILGFSGFLTYCFSYELELFMVAEFILGIGQSLISGSDSAMLYDTLMEHKKSKEYAKYEGRLTAFGNFAESIAGVLGGSVLVLVSLRMPFYFQAGVAFLAIPAALTLYEPMRHKTLMRFSFKDILKIVKDSLVNNKKRKTTIIFSSFIGTCTLTMAWFVQPYFLFVDVPLPLFGVFWPLLNLLVGVVSIYAYRVEYKLGARRSAIFIGLSIPLAYYFLSVFQAQWAIIFIFVFYGLRGFAAPVLKDYINRTVTSDIRATVLSVRNLIIRGIYSIIGLTMGWVTANIGLQQAFLAGGVLFTLLILSGLFFFLKYFEE